MVSVREADGGLAVMEAGEEELSRDGKKKDDGRIKPGETRNPKGLRSKLERRLKEAKNEEPAGEAGAKGILRAMRLVMQQSEGSDRTVMEVQAREALNANRLKFLDRLDKYEAEHEARLREQKGEAGEVDEGTLKAEEILAKVLEKALTAANGLDGQKKKA